MYHKSLSALRKGLRELTLRTPNTCTQNFDEISHLLPSLRKIGVAISYRLVPKVAELLPRCDALEELEIYHCPNDAAGELIESLSDVVPKTLRIFKIWCEGANLVDIENFMGQCTASMPDVKVHVLAEPPDDSFSLDDDFMYYDDTWFWPY
jgi:hypothetical protein